MAKMAMSPIRGSGCMLKALSLQEISGLKPVFCYAKLGAGLSAGRQLAQMEGDLENVQANFG